MKQYLAYAALAAASIFMLIPTSALPPVQLIEPVTLTADTAPLVRCEEDMPCWDCHTMGNRICGTLPHTL